MNQTGNEASNQSNYESLSLDEIVQLLDNLEKKYSLSSNTTLITIQTPINQITFVPPEKQNRYSRTESRIHNSLKRDFINTLGDLLKHYHNNHETISVHGIGQDSSSFIIDYIQAFEKQQQHPQYNQNALMDQRLDLATDQNTISSIIRLLETSNRMNGSLVEQLLIQFKNMKTEEDKSKLKTLIITFENMDLLERAKAMESILNKREEILYNLFANSLTKRNGAFYENECK